MGQGRAFARFVIRNIEIRLVKPRNDLYTYRHRLNETKSIFVTDERSIEIELSV
jgi:hypothetical protein